MTTYTAIPDADIDTDSPITQSLMTLMRDNPIAVTEGASGAPRIVRGAIAAGVGHRWLYDYGDGSDGPITHTTSAAISPGLYQCTTFEISATSPITTITLSARGFLMICATTSITINGVLDVDGMGAEGYVANGSTYDSRSMNGIYGGSGGGGGGVVRKAGAATLYTPGGASGNPTGSAGAAQSAQVENLLLATLPQLMSIPLYDTAAGDFNYYGVSFTGQQILGGGGGGGGSNAAGGDGGGVIVLCAPTITVGAAGVITADGKAGAYSTYSSGGGGGGAIIIATPSGGYTNNGSVAANGGAGGTGGGYTGGNGGAGIVAELTV